MDCIIYSVKDLSKTTATCCWADEKLNAHHLLRSLTITHLQPQDASGPVRLFRTDSTIRSSKGITAATACRCLSIQASEAQHTCVLSEEDVLALQVGMHHLVAVKEHKPPNDIQSHQVTLPALPTKQLQEDQPASKYCGTNGT